MVSHKRQRWVSKKNPPPNWHHYSTMPIHYCLVAKAGGVAAEYSATSGNFSMIAQRLLEKISTDIDTRKTFVVGAPNARP